MRLVVLPLRIGLMAMLLAGAACSPQEQAADPPIARGTTLTLAQTPQTDPPVLIPSGGRLLAFWIGSDERGVHQDARIVHQDALERVVTLPLPPIHPYAQDGLSAPDGSALLFWLDEHPETPERAALYAAWISANLEVERGPVQVSDMPVYQYALMTDAAGGAWAVWSGGAAGEPALFARQIDYEGRPLEARQIFSRGAYPALTYDALGRRWLFWLANGQIWRGQFENGQLAGEPEALTAALQLGPGDRLTGLKAGSDGTFGYLFWNVARAAGAAETWMIVGSFNDPYWAQPRRLNDEAGAPVRFAAPLDQPAAPLPVAILQGDALVLRYGEAGLLSDPIAVLSPLDLLRAPALRAQPDGELVIAWASPGGAAASLNLLRVER
ncbi:MAG: hypothetical protein IPK19_03500 [Chloroflexi bacterium]|nr:hypothetical protein [Chloroflexota bacterium]